MRLCMCEADGFIDVLTMDPLNLCAVVRACKRAALLRVMPERHHPDGNLCDRRI